jgi:hypothetical protein
VHSMCSEIISCIFYVVESLTVRLMHDVFRNCRFVVDVLFDQCCVHVYISVPAIPWNRRTVELSFVMLAVQTCSMPTC